MKKNHLILINAVVIIVVGIYFTQQMLNGDVKIDQNEQTNNGATTIDQSLTNKDGFSREDILSTNWPVSTHTSLQKLKEQWNVSTSELQSHLDNNNNILNDELYPKGIFVDEQTDSIYFIAYVTYPTGIPTEFTMYEYDDQNKTIVELTSWSGYAINMPRFSPDKTKFDFLVYKLDQKGEITGYDFHIIDLIEPQKMVTFQIPGSIQQFKSETQQDDVKNIIGAYRFVNEYAIEFTRYFANGNDIDGYIQISDKELWSYDIETKKLTRLQTIPFEK